MKIVVSFLFSLFFVVLYSQIPTQKWIKTYGGNDVEPNGGTGIIANYLGAYACIDIDKKNGNIYVATSTSSNDGDVKDNKGITDVWVFCLNTEGEILWSKVFGGSDLDKVFRVRALKDGGCLIVGLSYSTDGFFNENHSDDAEGFIIRLNENGDVVWKKQYGGFYLDYLYDAIETTDGKIVAVGFSASFDGDLKGSDVNHNWICKIEPDNGKIIWSKSELGPYGVEPKALEVLFRVTQISDGTIMAIGSGTPDFLNIALERITAFAFDLNGNLKWQRRFDAPGGNDNPAAILPTANNTAYIVGKLYGKIGGSGVASQFYGGIGDIWLIHIDKDGKILWEKNYGGTDFETPYDAFQDVYGDLYIVGTTRSNDIDFLSDTLGMLDAFLMKINPSTKEIVYHKRIGGSYNDFASGIIFSKDQGHIYIAGGTDSNEGELSSPYEYKNVFVTRLDDTSRVNILKNQVQKIRITPNPTKDFLNIINAPDKFNVIIYDMFGKIVKTSNQPIIAVDNLPEGIYILRLFNDEMNFTTRFTKF